MPPPMLEMPPLSARVSSPTGAALAGLYKLLVTLAQQKRELPNSRAVRAAPMRLAEVDSHSVYRANDSQ